MFFIGPRHLFRGSEYKPRRLVRPEACCNKLCHIVHQAQRMHMQSLVCKQYNTLPFAAVRTARTGRASCIVSAKAVSTGTMYGDAGTVMNDINNLTMNNKDMFDTVKWCANQAVSCVLGDIATVQAQGSAVKGTDIPDSDFDFFVRLHWPDDTVTRSQRMQISECMRSRLAEYDLQYRYQPGENRVWFYPSNRDDLRLADYPEIDLVFAKFKDSEKDAPDNKALAISHVAQQVVKYIKYLPYIKTHLPRSKSSLTEQLVIDTYNRLLRSCYSVEASLTGAKGFDTLLKETLDVIAKRRLSSSWLAENPEVKLGADEWVDMASSLVRTYYAGYGWLRPVKG